jgi:hypothetical protein
MHLRFHCIAQHNTLLLAQHHHGVVQSLGFTQALKSLLSLLLLAAHNSCAVL